MSHHDTALLDAVEKIPGFLFPIACTGTMWLLNHQKSQGYTGGLVEIGVFQGKYFSVLARSAQEAGERLLGIDSFVYSDRDTVVASLAREASTRDAPVTIWSGESKQFDAEAVEAEIGGKARFFSVDGSHDAVDVTGDLLLAAEVLDEHGVLAIDDFLNPRALGVGEAAHLVLHDRSDLRPFALFGNKLFMSRPAHVERYKATVERFFELNDAIEGEAYRNLMALGRHQVEQDLWGARIIVM